MTDASGNANAVCDEKVGCWGFIRTLSFFGAALKDIRQAAWMRQETLEVAKLEFRKLLILVHVYVDERI